MKSQPSTATLLALLAKLRRGTVSNDDLRFAQQLLRGVRRVKVKKQPPS